MAKRRAHALALIGRIEQQELDRRRLELGRVESLLDRTKAQLTQQDGAWVQEASIAQEMPDGQRLMARFAFAEQLRREELRVEQERLAAEQARCLEAVTAQRTVVRRWEILAERAHAEIATIDERGSAAAIDELALLRHAHRQPER